MILTDAQRDNLTEQFNTAFSRTASTLSDLAGRGMNLSASEVSIQTMGGLKESLACFVTDEVASVHQVISGSVNGDAMLLLSHDDASQLIDLLTGEDRRVMDASGREILIEVGNILLNACLGMFGKLPKIRVTFSVPRLHLGSLNTLLNALVMDHEEQRYVLVIGTAFQLKDRVVAACLIILLGVASLEHLLQAVNDGLKT